LSTEIIFKFHDPGYICSMNLCQHTWQFPFTDGAGLLCM